MDADPAFSHLCGSGAAFLKIMRIHADPDPQHWLLLQYCTTFHHPRYMHGFNEEIGNSSTLFRPSWYSHTSRAKVKKPVSAFPQCPGSVIFWASCTLAGFECLIIFIGSCFCSSVPDPRHFGTDPRIRTSEVQIRIRILLSDLQDANKKNFFAYYFL